MRVGRGTTVAVMVGGLPEVVGLVMTLCWRNISPLKVMVVFPSLVVVEMGFMGR